MTDQGKPSQRRWKLGCLAVGGFLLAVFFGLPMLFQGGNAAQRLTCTANLTQVQGAKEQWALENKKAAQDAVTPADIAPYLQNSQVLECPAGGRYVLGLSLIHI